MVQRVKEVHYVLVNASDQILRILL